MQKVKEIVVEEDVPYVLQIKCQRFKDYIWRWGFTRNGIYDSKSGYKVLENIEESNSQHTSVLPPLEKKLWSDLWKTKTSPKLRHFLWRVLSGALAVKQQLSFRGILTDPSCPFCHQGLESICHMLFHCPMTIEVWDTSLIPLPQAGFSTSSVLLNIHYLISCSKKVSMEPTLRLAFPWILWHIWKTKNLYCFEKRRNEPTNTLGMALEEAAIWLRLNGFIPHDNPEIVVEEIPAPS